ncbi:hypothetical protein DVH24_005039 [Malus domestica]|uniref:ADP-ribosyl cyclase/cyclic ADP-ribose hydrolase n=1 Tax=Malus domestica TaxID=3750 RepID=A0A498IG77_MALDO|nr:hypothetical protein DVH24_005039 [Malus domestica]
MADPMTTKTSSPLPPFPTPPMKYQFFVSFRGLDTRKGFTDHLYNALVRDGIHTFRDEEQLESRKPISKELTEAIAESQIFVVVLSRNYATSTWCLHELASMVELAANDESRLILPVFYDVTPSEVRTQTGVCFEKAFAKHEKDFEGETEKVTRWKSSLTTIADLSGFDLRHYRYETQPIGQIVERIFGELNNTNHMLSNDLKDFVGTDQVDKIESNLHSSIGSEEVRIIGICGMPGVGKSTIAKALSQRIRNQFEAFSFISKVGEISKKQSSFHIQEQLCDHLLDRKVTTKDVNKVISERLCRKRVLIILDNVDELEQIEAVAGKDGKKIYNRFGKGSRIIVTTTDETLLTKYELKLLYKIEKLTDKEALLLFCRKAFNEDCPINGYEKLSYEFVDQCGGFPLASLKDHNYSGEERIIGTLKVSYYGLTHSEQKKMFLDVACFFNGEDVCRDFDRLSVYNSCFPSNIDLEWFGRQSNDYSRTISLPQNLNMDSNWLGLAVCANFAILEHLTSEIDKLDIPAISHNLSCHFESDKGNSLHHYCTSKEEFMRLHLGGFVWVSYIPRVWFSYQLNECSSLEVSVVSDHEAFSVHGCGLRLLHQHDEKEFTQAILQYMTSLCDKKGKNKQTPS